MVLVPIVGQVWHASKWNATVTVRRTPNIHPIDIVETGALMGHDESMDSCVCVCVCASEQRPKPMHV